MLCPWRAAAGGVGPWGLGPSPWAPVVTLLSWNCPRWCEEAVARPLVPGTAMSVLLPSWGFLPLLGESHLTTGKALDRFFRIIFSLRTAQELMFSYQWQQVWGLTTSVCKSDTSPTVLSLGTSQFASGLSSSVASCPVEGNHTVPRHWLHALCSIPYSSRPEVLTKTMYSAWQTMNVLFLSFLQCSGCVTGTSGLLSFLIENLTTGFSGMLL